MSVDSPTQGTTIRLVALDLDGTLLDDEQRMSARVQRVLGRAAASGVTLTLASGRPFASIRPWVDLLGIHAPVICYQGAVVTDPLTQNAAYQRTFSRHYVAGLRRVALAHDVALTLYVNDCIYTEEKRHSDAFYERWFGLPYRVVGDMAKDLPADPIKAILMGDGDLDAIQTELDESLGSELQIVRSHRFFLEALAPTATKGNALAWVARMLGVGQRETMAIGDSGNDRSMIEWAGVGVAMGNATDDAKAVADYVAPAIEDDGAAEAVERFCLGA